MLDDFEFEMELKQASSQSLNTSGMEVGTSGSSALSLPNSDSAISSGTHAISIIIELIRKNNSDYFEPYLFHTIRNRLIQVQQHLHVQSDEGRETLETAFNELVDRMGVVHLGPLLEIMCDRLERFQQLLHKPRSSVNIFYTLHPGPSHLFAEGTYTYNHRAFDTIDIRTISNLRTICRASPLLQHVTPQSTS